MRPAFSNALYYPTIDVRDTNWLKTAILFWDSISTIVPESLTYPYEQPETQYLADIGFLRPLYVNSDDKSVVGIEEDIIDLMCSTEFMQFVCSPQAHRYGRIWNDKMSYRVRERIEDFLRTEIYGEKISYKLKDETQRFRKNIQDREIYCFDSKFADIYMIELANKL